MKHIIHAIFFLLTCYNVVAQTKPSGNPVPYAPTAYYRIGWLKADSALISSLRDTNFLPRFSGTITFRPQNIRPYFYDSTALRWYKLFSEPDTLTTLATRYDITQIPQTTLNNIGAGFRWVATPTGNIKTVVSSNTIVWDSTSNANALTPKADTSILATQYDILTRTNNGNLDSVLSLGGRLSANRSVSMGVSNWGLDSAAFRLRNVDSVGLSIDLAKAGSIIRFNKPEGVARTYPGSTPFKFIMENSTDDEPTERNNPVKWGWNINRADSANAAGIWFSMEPNYRPGGARWLEVILEASLPNGTVKNSRLMMATFKRGAGDSIESSENVWDFRGTTWNFTNLTNTIGYVGMGAGTLSLNNTTAGPTDFEITNGPDEGHFNLAPGTGVLEYSGTNFQIDGEISTIVNNGSSSGRAGVRFRTAGGSDAYAIHYGPTWAAQSYLQNAMVIASASPSVLDATLTLKADGTSWIGDIITYNTGSQRVNVSGSMAIRGLPVASTATYILGKNTDSSVVELTPASLATLLAPSIDSGVWKNNVTMDGDHTMTTGTNTWTITGNASFADGPLVHVNATGSVGMAVRGESTDGRGLFGVATTGVGVYGSATGAGGYALFGISAGSGGNAIYGSSTSGMILEGLMNPTSTNTVIPALSLTRSSQSAGANGIGLSIDFYNKSSTLDRLSNQIVSKWTDATDATRTSQFEIYGVNSATTARKSALVGTGQWTWDAYGVSTFSGTAATMPAFTSTGAVIEMPVNLTGSATLDFPNTSAGTSSDLTITVTGAADGDVVSIGVPNGSTVSNGCFTAWVSGANTVTIRYANNDLVSAFNPASGTFKATVIKH